MPKLDAKHRWQSGFLTNKILEEENLILGEIPRQMAKKSIFLCATFSKRGGSSFSGYLVGKLSHFIVLHDLPSPEEEKTKFHFWLKFSLFTSFKASRKFYCDCQKESCCYSASIDSG